MSDERRSLPGEGQPVPNYTGAFLVSFGVVLFMALFVLWVLAGLLGALLAGGAANLVIKRLAARS